MGGPTLLLVILRGKKAGTTILLRNFDSSIDRVNSMLFQCPPGPCQAQYRECVPESIASGISFLVVCAFALWSFWRPWLTGFQFPFLTHFARIAAHEKTYILSMTYSTSLSYVVVPPSFQLEDLTFSIERA